MDQKLILDMHRETMLHFQALHYYININSPLNFVY